MLGEHAKRDVRIVARPTADRRAWLEMARENALQALKARLTEQTTQGSRLAALREALRCPTPCSASSVSTSATPWARRR